jgi:2-iminobutanoate/2-iminopropanoate deaminase
MKNLAVAWMVLLVVSGVTSAQSRKGAQIARPREVVTTKDAPSAAGPYSQAIKAGGFVFVSGQVARDPLTNKLIEGDIKAQTERALKNVQAVLVAAGTDMASVVKTTVFLRSMADFAAMNEVYGQFFKENPPARSTVETGLPKDALIEIDVVALGK